jgi:heme exporter protein C
LAPATLVLVLAAVGAALGWAPRDAAQGNVARILYLHVPAILTAYAAIAVVFVSSILYLRRREPSWDHRARASAELALCFIGLNLVTGSMWGRLTWGVWWTWEPRLTLTALLFVIYLGYLLLRSVVEDPEQAATFSAIISILGVVDVFFIHFSVYWWRTLHQPPSVLRPQAPTMDASMLATLALNTVAFVCVYAYLAGRRYRLLTLEAAAREQILGLRARP